MYLTERHNITFLAGDTVVFRVIATDTTSYCADNAFDSTLSFTLEPVVNCHRWPNPFTPNDDGYNDAICFNYPEMFTKQSKLMVFDKRKQLVYETKIGPASDLVADPSRMWNGSDTNGQKLMPGLYFYIIDLDGEIVCEGTVTLVR